MIKIRGLGDRFAKKYGVSKAYALEVCKAVLDVMGDVLFEEREDLCINGFGTFRQGTTKERRILHPGTGEEMILPAKVVVKFRQIEAEDSYPESEPSAEASVI